MDKNTKRVVETYRYYQNDVLKKTEIHNYDIKRETRVGYSYSIGYNVKGGIKIPFQKYFSVL